ncbi:MAG: biopolymer transporter ExbD [Prevotella sp.]|nr:biopolymer transporter ExbD [Prevotella sp.]MCM1075255.1 biopolymer transporter ExbD [Ruminococcus sp.]
MGRVKQNKKSTFIDMTAMSDVTVLLLTFFMLTSTFLAKEPFQANTPPSVSEDEMPMNNVVEILVNPQGKIWLTMNNDTTQEASNAAMRRELLTNMQAEYQQQTGKSVKFTEDQMKVFETLGSFGVPFEQLPAFLSAKPEEQDAWISGKEEANGLITGIPTKAQSKEEKDRVRTSAGKHGLTEFQMWIKAASATSNDQLKQHMREGKGFSLKADQNTSFEVVHMVMDNLQTIDKNKFILVTALKTEED